MNSMFYASVFGVYSSPRDIKIEFSDTIPSVDEKGEVIVRTSEEKNTVIMSVATAKELATILSEHVAEYEKQYGEIPDLVKILRENNNKE